MRRSRTRSRSSRSMSRAGGRTSVGAACRHLTSRARTDWFKDQEAEHNMTVAKTGAEHIASLRDGRTVYIDGALVEDVTTHPAFRNAVQSSASLYDFQAKPENIELLTFMPEGSDRRVNRAWQMPKSYEEMVTRRKALQAWARVHYGFMGRSLDHVASALIGQRMGVEGFRKHGPQSA